ncbi:MAG TPA: tRNA pseudouridine(55) synthase TruB [Bacteroidetes bacterium]|nr:tRNA pseudouridine(55) synthase TruB [Bacteroidota bacterium]
MKKISELDFQAGEVLLFNKPKTWTSFDVVKKIRGLIRIKKVGHAGTLDPLATGMLILCTGKKTKTIESIQDQEKEYSVEFRLGEVTASYDAELPPENPKDCKHLTQEMIEAALPAFRGEITQIPPIYSAVKIDGKRAYKAARKGQDIKMRPRQVSVYEFRLEEFRPPNWASAVIRCSKGTYIRSLVHDLGQALGVGAYILELERTRIGAHELVNAWEIEEFAQALLASRNQQED